MQQPSEDDGGDDVEGEARIETIVAADGDENLACNGMQHEEGCRDGAHPRERFQQPLGRHLDKAEPRRTNKERHEEPTVEALAKRVDKVEGDESEQQL